MTRTKRCAIVGAGISGLATAYYLSKNNSQLQIDVYEASDRTGGVIRTEHAHGCILECGPDSFLTEKKIASELCAELNITTVGSNDSRRKTFLYVDGRLTPLPSGFFLMVPSQILPFITTDLISWPGKFDVMSDLFVSPAKKDLSVGDFIERRFGKEILEKVAEPLLAGVYGADIGRLSLKDALPRIWEMQRKGSLLLQARRARGKSSGSASLFTTLAEGMQTLPETLVAKCTGVNWRLGTPVECLTSIGNEWTIAGANYDTLVVACSSPIETNDPGVREIQAITQSVRRNSAIVILMGFHRWRADGFGWLVPATERRSIMACTYVSNKFQGRSTEDQFLVRLFLGGDQAATWLSRSDDEILLEARNELKRIADVEEEPYFHRICRWPNAMPEYAVGHSEKVSAIEKIAARRGNLHYTGNLFQGVGIPDCITHAKKTAAEILQIL